MEIGKRFGKLTFIGKSERKFGRSRAWIVKCDCGTVKTVCHSNVLSGSVKSCGCVRRNVYAKTPEDEIDALRSQLEEAKQIIEVLAGIPIPDHRGSGWDSTRTVIMDDHVRRARSFLKENGNG